MATTIKVSEQTRDQVNAIGARTHQTADAVVGEALAEYERALFWAAYAQAADEHPDEVGERALWDATAADGLTRG